MKDAPQTMMITNKIYKTEKKTLLIAEVQEHTFKLWEIKGHLRVLSKLFYQTTATFFESFTLSPIVRKPHDVALDPDQGWCLWYPEECDRVGAHCPNYGYRLDINGCVMSDCSCFEPSVDVSKLYKKALYSVYAYTHKHCKVLFSFTSHCN